MILRKVRVSKSLAGLDTCPWIKDQHALEEVNRLRVGILEFLFQRLPVTLGKGLDESKSLSRQL